MDLVFYDDSHEAQRIGILTLNHPEKRNALSQAMLEALDVQLRRISSEGRVNAVILRGAGPVFSSGHDLKEVLFGGPPEVEELFAVCAAVMSTIRGIPQVVIAEVQGVATAAGCQIVAAADLAVASTQARFATPGVRIGFFCTTPSVFLGRSVPRKKAAEMLFTGEYISAEDAERFGLVNRVVSPEQLSSEALALASQVARFSLATLGEGKKAFYRQLGMEDFQALAYASEVMVTESTKPDAKEGIGAFLEKRDPLWSDRSASAPKS
ncbi:MAG: enoyl-CoA hydratase-related protein [Thermaerobacter sp.]|nr:enoyl-CoA hydratase-related protein [Thermaerobacter sp.]